MKSQARSGKCPTATLQQPNLITVVLQYASTAGVHMEDIVDDELDLPANLPGKVKYKGVKGKSSTRKRR